METQSMEVSLRGVGTHLLRELGFPILVETEGSHWVVGQTPFRSHFAKFPLILLHAQNLIRYHHLSSHHLHNPLRNALVFQTLKQPSLRHSCQAVSKLPKAHSPRQHPSTCYLCVVVPCMLLFSCPFWVILDDHVR